MDRELYFGLNIIADIIVGLVMPFIYPISQVLMHLILASLILAIVFCILEREKRLGNYIVRFLVNLLFMGAAVVIAATIHSFLDPNYVDSGPTNTGGRYRYYIV